MTELRTFIIGIIFVSMTITTLWLASYSLADQYGGSVSDQLTDLWGVSNTSFENTQTVLERLDNRTRNPSGILGQEDFISEAGGFLNIIVTNAYTALVVLADSFTAGFTLISQGGYILGVPEFILTPLLAMIMVIILLAIVSAVHKYRV